MEPSPWVWTALEARSAEGSRQRLGPHLASGEGGGEAACKHSGVACGRLCSSCASFLREMHLKSTRCAEQFVSKALTKLVSL